MNVLKIKNEIIMQLRKNGIGNLNDLNLSVTSIRGKVNCEITISSDNFNERYKNILEKIDFNYSNDTTVRERVKHSELVRNMSMGKISDLYKNKRYLVYKKIIENEKEKI